MSLDREDRPSTAIDWRDELRTAYATGCSEARPQQNRRRSSPTPNSHAPSMPPRSRRHTSSAPAPTPNTTSQGSWIQRLPEDSSDPADELDRDERRRRQHRTNPSPRRPRCRQRRRWHPHRDPARRSTTERQTPHVRSAGIDEEPPPPPPSIPLSPRAQRPAPGYASDEPVNAAAAEARRASRPEQKPAAPATVPIPDNVGAPPQPATIPVPQAGEHTPTSRPSPARPPHLATAPPTDATPPPLHPPAEVRSQPRPQVTRRLPHQPVQQQPHPQQPGATLARPQQPAQPARPAAPDHASPSTQPVVETTRRPDPGLARSAGECWPTGWARTTAGCSEANPQARHRRPGSCTERPRVVSPHEGPDQTAAAAHPPDRTSTPLATSDGVASRT